MGSPGHGEQGLLRGLLICCVGSVRVVRVRESLEAKVAGR